MEAEKGLLTHGKDSRCGRRRSLSTIGLQRCLVHVSAAATLAGLVDGQQQCNKLLRCDDQNIPGKFLLTAAVEGEGADRRSVDEGRAFQADQRERDL